MDRAQANVDNSMAQGIVLNLALSVLNIYHSAQTLEPRDTSLIANYSWPVELGMPLNETMGSQYIGGYAQNVHHYRDHLFKEGMGVILLGACNINTL